MKCFIFLLVSATLLMQGCSTTPVSKETAKRVPADRIFQNSYVGPAVSPSDATILFSRDAGFFGSGCTSDIFVDNVKIFAVRHAEQITIHVSAGSHFIRLESGGGLCPNVAASQQTTIAAGDHQAYRILLPSDGSLRLTRME